MFRNKFTILLLISALFISQANAANLYKYKDDQGREITGSRVPAEFVKNGYQVLNERGQVIEVVQRTLTAEERAAQSEQLEQQRLLEQAALRQEEETGCFFAFIAPRKKLSDDATQQLNNWKHK
jgi:hypothetical protein